MEILKIEWTTGFLEIYPDKFFPCTVDKAKQVFKLMGVWCSDETIMELRIYFIDKITQINKEINEIKKIYPNTRIGSKEKKNCEVRFKQLKTLVTKYDRMIKILQEQTERK